MITTEAEEAYIETMITAVRANLGLDPIEVVLLRAAFPNVPVMARIDGTSLVLVIPATWPER